MSAEKYFNGLQQQREREFLDVGRNLFQQLVVEAEVHRLPESIFRNYFLPQFLGDIHNDKWVLEWIGIAGSPTREVDVIDGSGKVLFRVPAFLHTRSLFLDSDQSDLANIINESIERSRNLPIMGHRYLVSGLSAKSQEITNKIDNQDSVDKWTIILDRYNIRGNISLPKTSQEHQNLDDFISY